MLRPCRPMAGSGLVSALGDQFTLIALPWLVLQLSGDPLAPRPGPARGAEARMGCDGLG